MMVMMMMMVMMVLSVFRRNSSTFDVTRDRRYGTTRYKLLRRTVSRTMGLKLVGSPTVSSGFCRRINTSTKLQCFMVFQSVVDDFQHGVCETSGRVLQQLSRDAGVPTC